jgi:hypothetical protein
LNVLPWKSADKNTNSSGMAAGYHVTPYLFGILHDITSQKAVILIVTALKP